MAVQLSSTALFFKQSSKYLDTIMVNITIIEKPTLARKQDDENFRGRACKASC
jgi:hypothetical protein